MKSFRIYFFGDHNGDGIAQDNEIYNLSDFNIREIRLDYVYRPTVYGEGGAHSNETATIVYENSDGELVEGVIADVWFELK